MSNAELTIHLMPYVTWLLASIAMGIYRRYKPYRKEPVRNRWDYIERNPVEISYLVMTFTLATVISSGVGDVLKLFA